MWVRSPLGSPRSIRILDSIVDCRSTGTGSIPVCSAILALSINGLDRRADNTENMVQFHAGLPLTNKKVQNVTSVCSPNSVDFWRISGNFGKRYSNSPIKREIEGYFNMGRRGSGGLAKAPWNFLVMTAFQVSSQRRYTIRGVRLPSRSTTFAGGR